MDQNRGNVVGKADDYRLCDLCGRNFSIKEIAGKCQYHTKHSNSKCDKWICVGCGLRCAECGKLFCTDHARELEKEELEKGEKRGKVLCHHCIPLSKRWGCFIATAAYGTPFAKEIIVLQQWRDNTLTKNFLGCLFVKIYYKISPPLANFIKDRKLLRKIVRTSLKPLIKIIKK